MELACGKSPFSIPTKNTAENSSPLQECKVISGRTPLSSLRLSRSATRAVESKKSRNELSSFSTSCSTAE